MTGPVSAREIAITRVFDAPRELVWKAWTEPDRLAQWWGKRGWSTPPSTIEMDVRRGGRFRLISVSDADGSEIPLDSVYREVVEPARLVFVQLPRDGEHEATVATVTFTDLGDGRTEMTFRTTVHMSDEVRAAAQAGLASALHRLDEHLASARTR